MSLMGLFILQMQVYHQLKIMIREHAIADAILDIARVEIAHGNSEH